MTKLCNCPFDTSLEHLDTFKTEGNLTHRYCGVCRGLVSTTENKEGEP